MEFTQKKIRAKQHAQRVKERNELRNIYHSNDIKKKSWTFSKKLTAFMIVNCTLIEVYALYVMWAFGDLSALPTLITAVIGECIGMLSYAVKSTFENTKNGITYETAMNEMKCQFHRNDELTEDERKEAVG